MSQNFKIKAGWCGGWGGLIVALAMIAVTLVLLTSTGCQTGKAWQDLSPKGKALVLMATYNEQFDSYLADAAKPDLTDEEKEALSHRLTVIQSMHYAVTTYVTYVRLGQAPSMELEIEILKMAEDLAGHLKTEKEKSNGR